jgi:hypothetical protein
MQNNQTSPVNQTRPAIGRINRENSSDFQPEGNAIILTAIVAARRHRTGWRFNPFKYLDDA